MVLPAGYVAFSRLPIGALENERLEESMLRLNKKDGKDGKGI